MAKLFVCIENGDNENEYDSADDESHNTNIY